MKKTEIAVVGGGPAGMSAALAAAAQGAKVSLFDSAREHLGGQLIKQTHRFFGSEKENAGTRGIEIRAMLEKEILENENIDVHMDSTVLSIYYGNEIGVEEKNTYDIWKYDKLVVATGASEKMLPFTNNDMPGVYGAGAVQTLMNVYGVTPGKRVLMIGSGNIGLIVSYQLMQAGVKVAAIVEALPNIGGYRVHASKVRRMQVPILTSHTVLKAYGDETVEGAVICEIDDKFQPVPGTEQNIECDIICLSVGLSPLTELMWPVGCKMKYVPALGGNVPLRDEKMETTTEGIYVAGDASGVEEATAAMIEGKIAGLSAAAALGYDNNYEALYNEYVNDIRILRSGPTGAQIRQGLAQLREV